MRNGVRLAICSSFALCCLFAQENDWLIVPGKRIGPITAAATRADIARIFGAKNLEEDEIQTSDMASEVGTKVFWDQPEIALAIFWMSDAADAHIRRVRVCATQELPGKCRWHTAEGITLGTSLKELERLNGHAFQLNGFDWGFGGLITSWSGGRLQKLAASCGTVNLRVDPPPGNASDERARLLDDLDGDEDFASSHASMQALNPVIDFMSVSFQNCK
jgi:hypothetical protein